MRAKNVTIVVSCIIPMAGCGSFYDPAFVREKSIEIDKAIITDSNTKGMFAFRDPVSGNRAIYCVEPSPDTSPESQRQAQGGVQGSVAVTPPVGQAGGTASVNITGSGTSNVTIEKLFDRSQGIQLARDVLFNACVAQVNGFIGVDQYYSLLVSALQSANTLIAAQVAADKGLGAADNTFKVQALKDFYSFVTFPSSARPAWLPDDVWNRYYDIQTQAQVR